ncbi:hypothetical protein VEE44_37640 [Escherichia coli]|nr:hypothetical protein VEE44_37640 [Escherichia coli]
MTRLASRFGAVNLVRRDRPLTRDELAHYVPSVFSEEKHESRSNRYTYIPTITLLDDLQREGFQPFFACQTRVRDQSKREHTKHMLRLRREGQITGKQVPEIILLNSHDGSSSYQMLPGLFRSVCQNGLICGESFGEVRVPHKGNVVEKVIEGAYEVLGIFDRVEEKRDAMQSLLLPPPAQEAMAKAALTYRFGEEHQPVTEKQILSPRRWQDESNDLWTTYQRIQENLIKGGLSGRTTKGQRSHSPVGQLPVEFELQDFKTCFHSAPHSAPGFLLFSYYGLHRQRDSAVETMQKSVNSRSDRQGANR